MKLMHRDPRGFEARLSPETLDDLWHLSHLIDKGDLVTAWTLRTKEAKGDVLRGEKMSKSPVELTIRVEEVEFAEFTDVLRVRGPIAAGSNELGSYHTLSFLADGQHDLLLRKENGFRRHHWDRVQESVEAAKRPLVTILCIDDEEATIAVLRQYGVHGMATLRRRGSGKMYPAGTDPTEEYFREAYDVLKRVRANDSPLVVVGPGFTRESFLEYARQRDPSWIGKCVTEGIGQSGMVGVQEALKRGIVERIQQGQQVASDTVLVEELFSEIAQSGAVGFGEAEVRRLLDQGAVKQLVITDELLRTEKGEELLSRARQTQAKTHIVATTHEAGKKLQSLGGVAAFLRYHVA